MLKDINLTVPTGSTSVLFGPNGSGKSTLLATIMGLGGYKVVTGKILLNGENITGHPCEREGKKRDRHDVTASSEHRRRPIKDDVKSGL